MFRTPSAATLRRLWAGLLAAQMAVVCALAFMPAPPPAADLGWDKANHLLAFAVMAATAVAAWGREAGRARFVWALLLALGAFIEAVQSQLPARSAEWGDLAADAVGIAAGLAGSRGWAGWRRARRGRAGR